MTASESSDRRVGRPIEEIAQQVATAAESTGLGFLLARIATDRILDGSLDPSSDRFEAALYGQAAELLLDDQDRVATDRALLRAASSVSVRGIPIGPVWEVAARAIDPSAEPSLEEQLALVRRLGRFLVEEQVDGEVLYRPFHPALREHFCNVERPEVEQVAGTGASDAALRAVAAALVRLHIDARTVGPLVPGGDRFLHKELPLLLANLGDGELLGEAVAGGTGDDLERQARALLVAADDAIALQQPEVAIERAQLAARLAPSDRLITHVDASLEISAALRAMDDWRNARDVARDALATAERLLDGAPEDSAALGSVVRAAAALASALGVGFDAEEGVEVVDAALDRLASASPGALASVAADLADLLLVYPEYLGFVLTSAERLGPARAARTVLARLVADGLSDKGPRLGFATCFEATCRLDTGDSEGLPLLRAAVEAMLDDVPVRGIKGLDTLAATGELIQRLGVGGRHQEAFGWATRAISEYERIFDAFGPDGGSASVVAYARFMRSAVASVHGDVDAALEDARLASDLTQAAYVTPPLANRLLDAGRPDEVIARTEGAPEPLVPQVDWWRPVAQAELALRDGSLDENVIELLRRTLARLERYSQPRPDITYSEFVDYEPELRTSLTLARALESVGGSESAREAREQGARIFLRRIGRRSPRGLLHVNPVILEECRSVWSPQLLPETRRPQVAEDWMSALERLAVGGREALFVSYMDGSIVDPVMVDDGGGHVPDWAAGREHLITTITTRTLDGLAATPRWAAR